jgi:hypothetical protein
VGILFTRRVEDQELLTGAPPVTGLVIQNSADTNWPCGCVMETFKLRRCETHSEEEARRVEEERIRDEARTKAWNATPAWPRPSGCRAFSAATCRCGWYH